MATKTRAGLADAPLTFDTLKGTEKSKRWKRQAKSIGLNLTKYRVLMAIGKSGKRGLNYRGIEAETAVYNPLTTMLREDREGSMGAAGLIREEVHDVAGKNILFFVITEKGKEALREARKVK